MSVHPFAWLAFSFFGYYCAYGVFVPFFPVWLKSQAYGEQMIGLVLAFSYLFRFIGGIYFSGLVKRASQLPAALRLLAWCSVGIMLVIALSAAHFWLLFAAIALFAIVNAAGIPLSDTLATTWQRQIRLDYGKARLIGSAAFVVGVTLFGYLIGILGDHSIIWIIGALLLCYALLQMARPTVYPADDNTAIPGTTGESTIEKSAVGNSADFIALLKNTTTLRLLIAISLIQGSHAVYYGYSVLYWTELGFSVQTTSLLWGLSVASEILLFFFSGRLFRHWHVSALFYLSALAAIARWLGFAFAEGIWLILLFQTFHSLTYAVGHYAMMRYITTQPQNTMSKLQGLYNGFASSAAVALLTALGGVIYPLSPPAAFLTMAGFTACALLITPRKVEAFLITRH